MCYRRKTTCREPVVHPSVWERGIPTRGLTGRPLDLVAEALDTMGFFKCPRLRRGLAREYWFLPWSLRREWCGMTPRDAPFRDGQGGSLGNRPDPIPMPDGPTRSCCPLDAEYETGSVKGRKCQLEEENPEVLLKRACRQKGKGKSKASSGTKEAEVATAGSHVVGFSRSADVFGESVAAEEACLIDAAIASLVTTNRVKSMLCTQSARAGPSSLPTRFEGTREPRQVRPFTGFSPTVNEESRVLVTGKFHSGTLSLAGGPLPPLVEDDDKEETGEVEGLGDSVPAPVVDVSVLDNAELYHMEEEDVVSVPVPVASELGRVDLFCVEEDPWDDMDLEMNPWADS